MPEKTEIRQEYLDKLADLIKIPSVSAKKTGLKEASQLISGYFQQLKADQVAIDDEFEFPLVIAKFKAAKAGAKTILIYNHYDVQPAEPFDLWHSDPWTLTQRDGKLFGRGVDDDKGNLLARLTALAEYLDAHDHQLPVNIDFVVEGSEETASRGLSDYLIKHAAELQNDLVIWESGGYNSKDQQEINGGTKGIVTFDLVAKTADRDLHSSLAPVIDSAAWQLLEAINSLRNPDGTIAVKGVYDTVRPASTREQDLVEKYSTIDQHLLVNDFKLTAPLLNSSTREELLKALYFSPALNIEGISSGYEEAGVKTVLPAQAVAKLEIRLVPDQDPHDIFDKVAAHLKEKGFTNVKAVYTLGEKPYRSDLSADEIQRVIAITKHIYGDDISLLPTSPGTGPAAYFYDNFKSPIAAVGIGYAASADHAPDENVRLKDYDDHIEFIKELISSYE
ncbi:MAG: M20/M25/M40 family metallo-hydrolase [Oenococcus sp.]|uniref:Acetylornithine deacetylase/Succinyl-diaminopimelate desuccinylase n=1 Tax=Oenococcus kitaharae DSM 17330 TaxID=1045004 RepID=G9WIV8_9LACO|nr:M20/M25/M40 family metallo-hydrolase [Oenococcus kitaharae]EHN58407.1 Acetylornithine deacetylase/Succinyl-diaminopimelate desuccinylase [Oenococcus kitaharae DSM 17330]MCV3296353.1 M20/M25/M40 family metallo-hydrolase [Oenococcus kitaharae]OEY81430.1 peptidase M20 [Oenococcus kitaharae]OEY82918.1 peptidase M20 [Oenococcus kitaharae]OEY84538.1 peptidase M20 [Oenococcus kitaharae]